MTPPTFQKLFQFENIGSIDWLHATGVSLGPCNYHRQASRFRFRSPSFNQKRSLSWRTDTRVITVVRLRLDSLRLFAIADCRTVLGHPIDAI